MNILLPTSKKKVDVYKGEMYFFRAYVMHRAALLFCEDYDPDVQDQPGLPIRKSGSRKQNWLVVRWQLCMRIEADLVASRKTVTAQGTATDQIYLTKDAITAFRAELALHTTSIRRPASMPSLFMELILW